MAAVEAQRDQVAAELHAVKATRTWRMRQLARSVYIQGREFIASRRQR
jgi:hypothetical protein